MPDMSYVTLGQLTPPPPEDVHALFMQGQHAMRHVSGASNSTW